LAKKVFRAWIGPTDLSVRIALGLSTVRMLLVGRCG
jgi:hypothetical protein